MSDPYMKEIVKQKSNWIEDITNKSIPSEESLKDFSKGMLAHNIGMLKDELKTIKKERDDIYKENSELLIVIKDQRKRIEDLKKKIIKIGF